MYINGIFFLPCNLNFLPVLFYCWGKIVHLSKEWEKLFAKECTVAGGTSVWDMDLGSKTDVIESEELLYVRNWFQDNTQNLLICIHTSILFL